MRKARATVALFAIAFIEGCTASAAVGVPADAQRDGAPPRADDGVTAALDVTEASCSPRAVPDDGVDDAPAFACALAELAPHGGVLHVPAGTWDLGAPLVVPRHVTVEGTGFGTVLAQPHRQLGPVLRLQAESALRDLMLTQEQPLPAPGWAPFDDYDFQVAIEGDQVTVSGVKLLNPVRGIRIAPADPAGAVGQVQLFNVRAQPLLEGIRIDHALDVIHVQQIHFWPFWSADPAVLRYTSSHGVGLHSLRDDNPLFSEMFFFAYAEGVRFGQSTGSPTSGITSKPKVSQMDCDACGVAVHVAGAGTRGVLLAQVSAQGLHDDFGGGVAGVGLLVDADDTWVSLSQGDFTALAANAVRVSGARAVVAVTDTMVREWNGSLRGFPAYELVGGAAGAGSHLRVRGGATGEGHGAPVANADVVLDGVATGAPLR